MCTTRWKYSYEHTTAGTIIIFPIIVLIEISRYYLLYPFSGLLKFSHLWDLGACSYRFIEEIQKNNVLLIMPDPNKFERFLAPDLLIWARKLSDEHESIRYDSFKSGIFSIGLCILFWSFWF